MSVLKEVKERFHFLDGLRGIASLMIVIHHAFTANIVKGINHLGIPYLGHYVAYFTQSGVELFFVLSGVVLLRPYLRKQREFRTGDYLLRRIKRIYPPYLVALLFAAGVCWYLHAFPTWYNTKVYHMVFYWPEILRESVIINFDGQYYNLAWWSLGIEMLFYFLVPLILLVFPWRQKMSALRMTLLITVTLVVSVGLQLWLTRYYPAIYSTKHLIVNIYQAICYPVCFLLGIFLAARDFAARQAYVFIVAGVVLVGASIFYLPIVNPGYGLIYAGIIILSFNVPAFKLFLSKPIMIWLGERSYSLFLVHFSVFYLMDSVAARFTTSGSMAYAVFSRGAGIPVAFLAAMALFYFVERKQAKGLVTGNMFWPWQAGKVSRLDPASHVQQKSISDNLKS
jgi:peptidoglycan/LPS O-acetylase OafA/YrhL